jgi:hypothetical protein
MGIVLIGGDFTTVNGIVPRQPFSRGCGASLWRRLTVQPYGRVLMGTDYFTSEQVVRHEIARLNQDGSLDATFNAGTDARVDGTMVQPDETRVSARNSTAPRRRWRPPFRSTSSWAKHASITASRWTSDSCSHAFWSLDPGQICFLMDANSDVVALGLPRI